MRRLIGTILCVVMIGSCSEAGGRPSQFEGMTGDAVGCTIRYGDAQPRIVGPLGPNESEEIQPNSFTFFRVARTATDIVVVVERTDAESHITTPLNDMPTDGIVARGPFIDSGNPGYVVTCWRGGE